MVDLIKLFSGKRIMAISLTISVAVIAIFILIEVSIDASVRNGNHSGSKADADSLIVRNEDSAEISFSDRNSLFSYCLDIPVHLPIRDDQVKAIAYHQASSDNDAQAMQPVGKCIVDDFGTDFAIEDGMMGYESFIIMQSRGRATNPTTAVDISAEAGSDVYAPVTGVVSAAEPYLLYGKYDDSKVCIIPDGNAGIEAVMIHIEGISVTPGERVEAGITRIASLRDISSWFVSEISRLYTHDEGNHVHLQFNRL